MTEPDRQPREITISRRLFIASTLLGGATLAVGAVGVMASSPKLSDAFLKKLSGQPLSQRVAFEATRNSRFFFWTALETLVVFAVNVGLGNLVDRFGIEHGGHAADGELYADQLESKPVTVYFRDNIALPIFEEAIFRLFPSAFFSEERQPNIKLHWGTGLASAAFFAGIHNFSKPAPDKITVHLDSLPLEQFVLGVYCWYAQRSGGFVHAAGSHVLYNNLCEAYWHFYEKKHIEKLIAQQAEQQANGLPTD